MDKLVSIVITHYNYLKYIDECVESCLNQTYKNIEVIVVDDGSDMPMKGTKTFSPNTLYTSSVINVIFHYENKGYAAAKNTGIRAAKGNFICMIDADDKLTSNSIELRMNEFEKNPSLSLVCGLGMRWYGGDDIRGYNNKTHLHAQGKLYRKSVYKEHGLYYEGLRSMADKEYVYRLGIHPESPLPPLIQYKRLKKPVALYRKHDEAMHKVRRTTPKYNAEIKKTFKKRIKQLQREGITKENTDFL